MLTADAPVVLLLHGGLDNLSGKTGLAMLRYRSGPILAVVDPHQAGRSLATVSGIGRPVPVVASVREALPLVAALPAAAGPAVAVVGLAPSGGRLPAELHADLAVALEAGLSVASGLHSRVGEDPSLAARVQPGRWIWDLRREPADLGVGSAAAAALPCRRILAVGTDMAVGKMSACLELQAAALRRGRDARFVGTGQAGILIAGSGVALDAVRIDYAAGAVEQAVLTTAADAPADSLLLVEGQGSLCHPGSSATLPLLRGSQPTDLLLVHRAGQTTIRKHPAIPIPPLREVIAAIEALARLARPGTAGTPPAVRGIALNTADLDAAAAAAAIAATAAMTGLACDDPVRHGADRLLDALLAAAEG
jgi:uncharacterized NAD-dependent epimerase/dehydratase family protein